MLFFYSLIAGICCGALFGLSNMIRIGTKRNIIITILVDLVASLLSGAAFCYLMFFAGNGEFGLFDVIAFFIGIFLERISVGNLFANLVLSMYNKRTLRKNNKASENNGEQKALKKN